MRVLVPDPGDSLVTHPGHAAVEDGGLAEDGRHIPALCPDKLRPLPLQVTVETGHQVNIASIVEILILLVSLPSQDRLT